MNEKISTEHHKYLVALTFNEAEKDNRVILHIEKTDTDELMLTIDENVYYVSLSQFLDLVNQIE